MNANDFFGTLQDSITAEWRKHLQADNHDVHVILDEFYKEMPELVDALIEAWQADNDIVKDYNNLLDAKDKSALDFLQELKEFTKKGRAELLSGESELESLCDDILAQIDSTIYKLKRLTKEGTNESLSNFISRAFAVNEAAETWDDIYKMVEEALKNAKVSDNGCYLEYSNYDFSDAIKLIKKNKTLKLKKGDSLFRRPFIGVSEGSGEVSLFFVDATQKFDHVGKCDDGAYSPGCACHPKSASEAVSAPISFLNHGMSRVKRQAWECPAELVKKVYDLFASKF